MTNVIQLDCVVSQLIDAHYDRIHKSEMVFLSIPVGLLDCVQRSKGKDFHALYQRQCVFLLVACFIHLNPRIFAYTNEHQMLDGLLEDFHGSGILPHFGKNGCCRSAHH